MAFTMSAVTPNCASPATRSLSVDSWYRLSIFGYRSPSTRKDSEQMNRGTGCQPPLALDFSPGSRKILSAVSSTHVPDHSTSPAATRLTTFVLMGRIGDTMDTWRPFNYVHTTVRSVVVPG